MVVFDVDGTLIGGQTEDWASFEKSFEVVTGIMLEAGFYDRLHEVTARAIVHQILSGRTPSEIAAAEIAVCREHLARLRQAHELKPAALQPTVGALGLLKRLKELAIPVGIATGGWHETITFRLAAARIPYETIPLRTSSDCYARAEIIAAVVRAADQRLEQAVYVGDGLWDFRAAQTLGIPFIGVGPRVEKLRQAGAKHTVRDLEEVEFIRVLQTLRS